MIRYVYDSSFYLFNSIVFVIGWNFYMQVESPNLQKLVVAYNNHVEIIWQSLPIKLSSVVQNLVQLTLTGCYNLKVIFHSSEGTKDDGSTIKLPKLKHLSLWELPKLTSLCSGCSIQLPLLENLFVYYCDELTSIFDDKVCI